MVSEVFPTTSGQIYDEIKMGVYEAHCSKRCIFSPEINIRYSPGRHFVRDTTDETVDKTNTGIKLLHYRFLGKEYFVERSKKNMERMSEKNIQHKYHKVNLADSKHPGSLFWYESVKPLARSVI